MTMYAYAMAVYIFLLSITVILFTVAMLGDNSDHCVHGCNIDQTYQHRVKKRDNRLYPSDQSDQRNGTNATKRLPQAIIVGVKKAGTRALLEYLRLHPLVRAPGPEMHFFDRHYHLGLEWYRNRMPPTVSGQLTIEKTPGYFIRREVPARIYRMSPKTKILIVVRNPVTRAISDYTQSITKGRTSKKFEDLAFVDPKSDHPLVDIGWSAIRIGFYYKHMHKWLKYFPPHQIHFVSGEELITRPVHELRLVENFLRLPSFINEQHFFHNASKGFPCVKRKPDSGYRCLGKTKGRQHPQLENKTLDALWNYYRPLNEMFFNLTARDFGWNWKNHA